MGSLLVCYQGSTYAQPGSASDTLRISLLKSSAQVFSREWAETAFFKIPSAHPIVPDVSALRELSRFPGTAHFIFELPISRAQSLKLIVHEITVVAPGFQVVTSSGQESLLPDLRFYAGKVIGDDASTVALTLSEEGLEGLVYGKDYSYTLGKVQSATSPTAHVIYRTHELPQPTGLDCQSEEIPLFREVESQVGSTDRPLTLSNCRGVAIYLEADHQLYRDWGRDALYITQKILATFMNVAILYANEGIRIELRELKIWDTPDPFRQATTVHDLLYEFKRYWNARGNTFHGDIAHLLSSRINQGGVGYYGLSRKTIPSTVHDIAAVFSNDASRAFAFSASTGIQDSALPTLPTFSYNVYLMAHELGHNFGLPHTHSCLWEGGPIDNCGSGEDGSCPPGPSAPNGGTIMSYCPNLANGFGSKPGAKMNYELLAAQKLINSGADAIQITPAVVTTHQYQYTTLDVSNCTGTVLWSDGVFTQGSRTLLPVEPGAYFAACLVDGCLSAPAKASLTVLCVKPASCSVSSSGALSSLNGIGSFVFNTLLTQDSDGVPSNLGTFYEDFSCTQHTVVRAGETYPFTLSGTSDTNLFAKIYIDYNGDGQFSDFNEIVYMGLSLKQHIGTITPPPTALRGTPLRLRVIVNPLPIPNACSLSSSLLSLAGKANDYAVTVTDSSCPPLLRQSIRSGRWDDPRVWSCGTLPTGVDSVQINAGHYVTLPADFTGYAGNIELRGVLQPGPTSTLQIVDL